MQHSSPMSSTSSSSSEDYYFQKEYGKKGNREEKLDFSTKESIERLINSKLADKSDEEIQKTLLELQQRQQMQNKQFYNHLKKSLVFLSSYKNLIGEIPHLVDVKNNCYSLSRPEGDESDISGFVHEMGEIRMRYESIVADYPEKYRKVERAIKQYKMQNKYPGIFRLCSSFSGETDIYEIIFLYVRAMNETKKVRNSEQVKKMLSMCRVHIDRATEDMMQKQEVRHPQKKQLVSVLEWNKEQIDTLSILIDYEPDVVRRKKLAERILEEFKRQIEYVKALLGQGRSTPIVDDMFFCIKWLLYMLDQKASMSLKLPAHSDCNTEYSDAVAEAMVDVFAILNTRIDAADKNAERRQEDMTAVKQVIQYFVEQLRREHADNISKESIAKLFIEICTFALKTGKRETTDLSVYKRSFEHNIRTIEQMLATISHIVGSKMRMKSLVADIAEHISKDMCGDLGEDTEIKLIFLKERYIPRPVVLYVKSVHIGREVRELVENMSSPLSAEIAKHWSSHVKKTNMQCLHRLTDYYKNEAARANTEVSFLSACLDLRCLLHGEDEVYTHIMKEVCQELPPRKLYRRYLGSFLPTKHQIGEERIQEYEGSFSLIESAEKKS